jgi:hypothetical protein
MRRVPGRVVAGLVALVVLVAGITIAASPWSTAALPPLAKAERHYLALAQQGVAETSRWWDAKLGWYLDALGDHSARPLATLWDTNGLFETLDEIAIAQPTSQNLAAVTAFANGSERYWNPHLQPIPAYAPYRGDTSSTQTTWFDDNGWIGLAFLDAYKATGNVRYLNDAERAFRFIAAEGWDGRQGGGMWWDTSRRERSGEALAASADLAAHLYQITRKASYLEDATTYIGWANAHLLATHGVYIQTADHPYPYLITPKSPKEGSASQQGTRTATSSGGQHFVNCRVGSPGCKPKTGVTVNRRGRGPTGPHESGPPMVAMPHDGEGAMVAAMTALCEATGKHSWCKAAERLAGACIVWLAPFEDGPQYDSVLVRGLLTLYAHDHRARWYRFAVAVERLIPVHAQTGPGIYLHGWDGSACSPTGCGPTVPKSTPGLLRTDAGNLAVFADLATVAPPK